MCPKNGSRSHFGKPKVKHYTKVTHLHAPINDPTQNQVSIPYSSPYKI